MVNVLRKAEPVVLGGPVVVVVEVVEAVVDAVVDGEVEAVVVPEAVPPVEVCTELG
jgi:hypothetical protein